MVRHEPDSPTWINIMVYNCNGFMLNGSSLVQQPALGAPGNPVYTNFHSDMS